MSVQGRIGFRNNFIAGARETGMETGRSGYTGQFKGSGQCSGAMRWLLILAMVFGAAGRDLSEQSSAPDKRRN
jgi:hypothetical protein